MTEQTAPMDEHTLVVERVFDAGRELVWKAFTDPDELTKWWGPAGFTTPRETIKSDFRAGGAFRLTMVGPDGQEFPNDGHYGVVEPMERYSFGGTLEGNPMMTSVDTLIEFAAVDEGHTNVKITSRMVCVAEMPAMASMGWNSQLDKLPAVLAG